MIFNKLFGALGIKGKNQEKPFLLRAGRISSDRLQNVKFKLNNKEYSIANISSSGLVVVVQENQSLDVSSGLIQGIISFNELMPPYTSLEVHLKFVRKTQNGIAFQFNQVSRQVTEALNRYFSIELASASLVMMNSDVLKKEEKGTPVCCRSSNGSEIFFTHENGKILRFEIYFLNHYLEYEVESNLKYGVVELAEKRNTPTYKASSLVKFHDQIPEDVKIAAQVFIQEASCISQDFRSQLLKKF